MNPGTVDVAQTFRTADGLIAVEVSDDLQFRRLCRSLNVMQLARDARFATNRSRAEHHGVLIPLLQRAFLRGSTQCWITELASVGVPAGPVDTQPAA